MTDTRELILARLAVVTSGVDGIEDTYRNSDEPGERYQRSAILIFDADEIADPGDLHLTNRPGTSPNIISMSPGIHILLGAEPKNIGSGLNALRVKVLKAILTDIDLASLTKGGRIRYDGCSTALARGRAMEGEMIIQITFTYVLIPAAL